MNNRETYNNQTKGSDDTLIKCDKGAKKVAVNAFYWCVYDMSNVTMKSKNKGKCSLAMGSYMIQGSTSLDGN